jgi:hypothetical protein
MSRRRKRPIDSREVDQLVYAFLALSVSDPAFVEAYGAAAEAYLEADGHPFESLGRSDLQFEMDVAAAERDWTRWTYAFEAYQDCLTAEELSHYGERLRAWEDACLAERLRPGDYGFASRALALLRGVLGWPDGAQPVELPSLEGVDRSNRDEVTVWTTRMVVRKRLAAGQPRGEIKAEVSRQAVECYADPEQGLDEFTQERLVALAQRTIDEELGAEV